MGGSADALVKPALSFHAMRAGDLEAVVEIERCSSLQPWTASMFLRELGLPFSRIVVARRADDAPLGSPLGFLCRWLVAEELEVHNVAVHPDWRRRSVGRRLVEFALNEASRSGSRRAVLEVRAGNAAAIALYGGLGFGEIGRRRRYYDDGEDALLMALDLPHVGG